MNDYGDFLEVTNALTGRRVLINKIAVTTINEQLPGSPTFINFDPNMTVAAQESYDEIVEHFMSEDEDNYT